MQVSVYREVVGEVHCCCVHLGQVKNGCLDLFIVFSKEGYFALSVLEGEMVGDHPGHQCI